MTNGTSGIIRGDEMVLWNSRCKEPQWLLDVRSIQLNPRNCPHTHTIHTHRSWSYLYRHQDYTGILMIYSTSCTHNRSQCIFKNKLIGWNAITIHFIRIQSLTFFLLMFWQRLLPSYNGLDKAGSLCSALSHNRELTSAPHTAPGRRPYHICTGRTKYHHAVYDASMFGF